MGAKIAFMVIEAFAGAMALAFFAASISQLRCGRKKEAVYMAILCVFSSIEVTCLWLNPNLEIREAVTFMYFMALLPLLKR